MSTHSKEYLVKYLVDTVVSLLKLVVYDQCVGVLLMWVTRNFDHHDKPKVEAVLVLSYIQDNDHQVFVRSDILE